MRSPKYGERIVVPQECVAVQQGLSLLIWYRPTRSRISHSVLRRYVLCLLTSALIYKPVSADLQRHAHRPEVIRIHLFLTTHHRTERHVWYSCRLGHITLCQALLLYVFAHSLIDVHQEVLPPGPDLLDLYLFYISNSVLSTNYSRIT